MHPLDTNIQTHKRAQSSNVNGESQKKAIKLMIGISVVGTLIIDEKEVVWLGDIFWKGSMEFSSHRDFLLHHWCNKKSLWLENSIEPFHINY